jgi:hypothetical protein
MGNNPTFQWYDGTTPIGTAITGPLLGSYVLPAYFSATTGAKNLSYTITYGNNPSPICPPTTTTYTSPSTTINPSAYPNLIVSSVPSSATVCAGDLLTLNALGGGTYTWTGTGVATSGASVSFVPTATGMATVMTTNVAGCADTASIAYTVNPIITPAGQLALDANTSALQDVCDTATHTLSYTESAAVAPGTTIGFYKNGLLISPAVSLSSGQTITQSGAFPLNSIDTFQIIVMPPAGSCQNSYTDSLIIRNNLVNMTLTIAGHNLSVPLTAGATYQWEYNTGAGWIAEPGATSNAYSATKNGNRRCVATNNGCQSTSALQNITGVAIVDVGADNHTLSFYPNPTNGILHIGGLKQGSTYHIQVFSLDGKLLTDVADEYHGGTAQNGYKAIGEIDMSSFVPGEYVVQIVDSETGERKTMKIMKQ